MIKKTTFILLFIFTAFTINFLHIDNTHAAIHTSSKFNYNECVSKSGASSISGVATACRQWADEWDDYQSVCTIWIGTRSSSTLKATATTNNVVPTSTVFVFLELMVKILTLADQQIA